MMASTLARPVDFVDHVGMAKQPRDKTRIIFDTVFALAAALSALGAISGILTLLGGPSEEVTADFNFAARFNDLKDWQTLLAAVFGVVGLIVAHMLSTRHQRRRDEEIRTNEQSVRDANRIAETKAIATALRVEVDHLLMSAKHNIDEIQKIYPDAQKEPEKIYDGIKSAISFPRATIYNAFVDRLGLLPLDAIKKIAALHSNIILYESALDLGFVGVRCLVALEQACQSAISALAALDKIIDD